jgi:hypothetical protein
MSLSHESFPQDDILHCLYCSCCEFVLDFGALVVGAQDSVLKSSLYPASVIYKL